MVIQALNEGADFYLQKGGDPVSQFAELSNKIRYAINSKRAEETLKEKTAELDRFFNSSLDLLCIADTDGYFRRLNPEWERALGYSVSELEGKKFLDYVHPDDLAQTIEAVSILAGKKEIMNFENRPGIRTVRTAGSSGGRTRTGTPFMLQPVISPTASGLSRNCATARNACGSLSSMHQPLLPCSIRNCAISQKAAGGGLIIISATVTFSVIPILRSFLSLPKKSEAYSAVV